MRLPLLCVIVALSSFGAERVSARKAKPKARKAYEDGTRALSTGRFADAIRHFERCLEAAERPPCAFNLAVAHRGTGDFISARRVLTQLVDGRWGSLPAKRRDQARSLLQETEAQISTMRLMIVGDAETVTVRIDGEQSYVGDASSAIEFEGNPGLHTLLVSSPMFKTMEERVRLDPGVAAELTLELTPTRAAQIGRVVLEATSATDRVEIVGVGSGVGRYERELRPGTYQVRVDGDGGSQERTIEVEAGATLRVRLEAQRNRSLLRSPWFWAGTGLVVAGSVAAFFLLQDEEPLVTGTVDVVETLRR